MFIFPVFSSLIIRFTFLLVDIEFIIALWPASSHPISSFCSFNLLEYSHLQSLFLHCPIILHKLTVISPLSVSIILMHEFFMFFQPAFFNEHEKLLPMPIMTKPKTKAMTYGQLPIGLSTV